jgi:hypothetical protein
VNPGRHERLGEAEVVVERVELLRGIRKVTRIAERTLDEGRRLERGVDRGAHAVDVVERVEDPDHVDAGVDRLGDECANDVRREARVGEQVASAQQHLQADVGHRLAQALQAIPWVLVQEAQRDVEGRPAPALQRPKPWQQPCDVRCDGEHVERAHARRKQRLVRVAQCGVGHRDRGLRAQLGGERQRTQLVQALA